MNDTPPTIITLSPKINHPEGWVDNGETNRDMIYLAVKYRRAIAEKNKSESESLEVEASSNAYEHPEQIFPSLDYQELIKHDPDTERGKSSIRYELMKQLIDSQDGSIYHETPLALSVIEMMLDLIENGNFSSVCLAEIALINFARFSKVVDPDDIKSHGSLGNLKYRDKLNENKYEAFVDICSTLSDNSLSFYDKIHGIRCALGYGEDGLLPGSIHPYIMDCEKIAMAFFGKKKYKDTIVPSIESVAWALDATGNFAYGDYGFTQCLMNDTLEEFLDAYFDVTKAIRASARERLYNGQLPVRPEFPGEDFDLGLICYILSNLSGVKYDGDKVHKKLEFTHRFGKDPLSASVLAEVTCGKLLRLIDHWTDANHNCSPTSETNKRDTFLHHSPGGKPDAYAKYVDEKEKFYVTFEVSTAMGKGQIKPKSGDSSGAGDSRKSVYESDIDGAILHINEATAGKELKGCQKFVFLVSRDIPKRKDAVRSIVNKIVSEARCEGGVTIIPMSFKEQVSFIRNLRVAAQKEPSEMTKGEWLRILNGIRQRLIGNHSETNLNNLEKLSDNVLDVKKMRMDFTGRRSSKKGNDSGQGGGDMGDHSSEREIGGEYPSEIERDEEDIDDHSNEIEPDDGSMTNPPDGVEHNEEEERDESSRKDDNGRGI